MHTQRLFLQDLTPRHLTWLLKAVKWCHDVTIDDWLQGLQEGIIAFYEIEGKGMIGLGRRPECIFVEFLVGENLRPLTEDIVSWLDTVRGTKPLEMMVTRPALIRYYERLGFQPLAMWMRYDGRTEESTDDHD